METLHILCPPSEDTPDQLPSAQPPKRSKAATAKPTTIVSQPLTRNASKGSLPVTKADSHPTPESKKITSSLPTRKASTSKTVPHGTPVVSTSAQVCPFYFVGPYNWPSFSRKPKNVRKPVMIVPMSKRRLLKKEWTSLPSDDVGHSDADIMV
ncbi:hypothetical protein PCASD_17889 [Puccinia coronata f. sp. avenae]|uniref:Uncharacterized protein n=1 Tax=Puccinia coronata f. sp. avenae TaxID=200324 RepID=A0A2N5U922_9BASI|nr:hypothetical protein PCASD_17889 [Puccinia coronata f. sp. avenae]